MDRKSSGQPTKKRSQNRRRNRGGSGGPSRKRQKNSDQDKNRSQKSSSTSRKRKPESPKPVHQTIVDKILGFFGVAPKKDKGGKPSKRPPGGAKHPVTNERLFVGNLSYSVSEEELVELFSQVGKVESAEIAVHLRSNRSKGFGFVTMESIEDAEDAVEQLNGKTLDGREISVSGAKSSGPKGEKSRDNRQSSTGRKKSPRANADEREPARKPRKDRESNRGGGGKGRGKSTRSRGSSGGGSREPAVTPMDVPTVSSPQLSLTNLSDECGETELASLFEGIGKIENSEISETGAAKIELASVEEAQEAVRLLDGKDFMGKTLSISETQS